MRPPPDLVPPATPTTGRDRPAAAGRGVPGRTTPGPDRWRPGRRPRSERRRRGGASPLYLGQADEPGRTSGPFHHLLVAALPVGVSGPGALPARHDGDDVGV